MAIALDATSTKAETLTTDLTWEHTVTGSDTILFVQASDTWHTGEFSWGYF